MTTSACTFSATAGPLYHSFENVTQQPGCCVADGTGALTSAYGLNNTCHVLLYTGDAAPYRLTLLHKSTGNLTLSTGQCDALVMQVQSNGQYSAGDGTGPSDAGLASKYGYDGCVVGVSLLVLASLVRMLTMRLLRPLTTQTRRRRRRHLRLSRVNR